MSASDGTGVTKDVYYNRVTIFISLAYVAVVLVALIGGHLRKFSDMTPNT